MSPSAVSRRAKTCSLSMSGRVLISVIGRPRTVRSSASSAPARLSNVFSLLNIIAAEARMRERIPFRRSAPYGNHSSLEPPENRSIPPDRSRRAARILVELHRARHLRLGDENDLAQVKREVLHDLIDRLEYRDLASLYPASLRELLRTHAREHRVGFIEGILETRQQLRLAAPLAGAKLARTVAHVRRSPDSANDPLADIALEVH